MTDRAKPKWEAHETGYAFPPWEVNEPVYEKPKDGKHVMAEVIASVYGTAETANERALLIADAPKTARQRDMLLKAAKAIGCICIGTVMPKRAVDHSESCRNLTAAIAECEGKQDD